MIVVGCRTHTKQVNKHKNNSKYQGCMTSQQLSALQCQHSTICWHGRWGQLWYSHNGVVCCQCVHTWRCLTVLQLERLRGRSHRPLQSSLHCQLGEPAAEHLHEAQAIMCAAVLQLARDTAWHSPMQWSATIQRCFWSLECSRHELALMPVCQKEQHSLHKGKRKQQHPTIVRVP